MYFGPMMYGINYNLVKDHLVNSDEMTVKDQHFTMLFQTFCLMNIVNMLNCRVIGTPENKEYNVFRRIHHNWMFPIIVLGELNFQFAITNYSWLRVFFGCTPLTFWM
jgi:magnesium-transporting ATPase (P-type)